MLVAFSTGLFMFFHYSYTIIEIGKNLLKDTISPVVICQAQKNIELEIILSQSQIKPKNGYTK